MTQTARRLSEVQYSSEACSACCVDCLALQGISPEADRIKGVHQAVEAFAGRQTVAFSDIAALHIRACQSSKYSTSRVISGTLRDTVPTS